MAVPKKRTSKSRKGMRRAHDGIKYTAAVDTCASCGEPKLRHHVCMSCGQYKGRQVLEIAD
jgi:large subunit ribosomal protein L32